MAANLNVYKTSKKSLHFFAEVNWVIYRIRLENKNFDDMGTLSLPFFTFWKYFFRETAKVVL